MSKYILFGTEGCHLCEDAELLIQNTGMAFTRQDIMDDEQSLQRYAVRIPVLLHQASRLELGWPFDEEQLQEYLLQTQKT